MKPLLFAVLPAVFVLCLNSAEAQTKKNVPKKAATAKPVTRVKPARAPLPVQTSSHAKPSVVLTDTSKMYMQRDKVKDIDLKPTTPTSPSPNNPNSNNARPNPVNPTPPF